MSNTAQKKLHPLNITFDEPVVQVNKRVFERIRYLHNKPCSIEESLEYTELIHLLFHTHDEKEGSQP